MLVKSNLNSWSQNMHESNQMILRLVRVWIMFMIVVAGITCAFVFTEQGLNIFFSSQLIAFSYQTVMHRSEGQEIELLLLLSVIAITGYAYISPKTLNGFLFLPQLLYFFYGIGRLFIVRELMQTFRHFKQAWKIKLSNKGR